MSHLLDTSMLGRVRSGVAAPWLRAWRTSQLAAFVTVLHGAWASAGARDRWRLPGVVAVTAATTHTALQLTVRPVGWWWTIVPGVALLFGVTAVVLSLTASGHHD